MAGEFKAVLNIRVTPDMNVSFQFTHVVVECPEEADHAGERDAEIALAYVAGYARHLEQAQEEDER